MADQVERIGRHLPGRPATPLAVIALFLSLTEIVVGVGVIQTTGTVQFILTLFVVGFDIAIAAAFFLILWFRNHILYPPSEYGREVPPAEYVAAMQGLAGRQYSSFQAVVLGKDVESTGALAETSLTAAAVSETPRTEPEAATNGDPLAIAQKQIEDLTRERDDAAWQLRFEILNRVIYLSQFSALQMLVIRGSAGATEAELQQFMDQHEKALMPPGTSRLGSLVLLLSWPVAQSLMTRDANGRYFATGYGAAFVNWAQQNAAVTLRWG